MRTLIAAALFAGWVPVAVAQTPAAGANVEAITEQPDVAAAAVAKAAMLLMFTRVIGVTGVEKAPTAAVKQLSLEIATTSAAMLVELKAATAVSGLAKAIPATLDRTSADQAELLQSSFETQFVHEYLGMQIAAHREVIGVLAAGGNAAAPAIGALALKFKGRLTTNLASLEHAKRSLPAM